MTMTNILCLDNFDPEHFPYQILLNEAIYNQDEEFIGDIDSIQVDGAVIKFEINDELVDFDVNTMFFFDGYDLISFEDYKKYVLRLISDSTSLKNIDEICQGIDYFIRIKTIENYSYVTLEYENINSTIVDQISDYIFILGREFSYSYTESREYDGIRSAKVHFKIKLKTQ